ERRAVDAVELAVEMLALTADQVRQILAAAAGSASAPLLAAALGTGCRQGELLGLAWQDVDLKAGTVAVRRSPSQTKEGFGLKEPKTAAGGPWSCRRSPSPPWPGTGPRP